MSTHLSYTGSTESIPPQPAIVERDSLLSSKGTSDKKWDIRESLPEGRDFFLFLCNFFSTLSHCFCHFCSFLHLCGSFSLQLAEGESYPPWGQWWEEISVVQGINSILTFQTMEGCIFKMLIVWPMWKKYISAKHCALNIHSGLSNTTMIKRFSVGLYITSILLITHQHHAMIV